MVWTYLLISFGLGVLGKNTKTEDSLNGESLETPALALVVFFGLKKIFLMENFIF